MEKTLGLHLLQDGILSLCTPLKVWLTAPYRVTVIPLGSSLQSLHIEGLCEMEKGDRQLRMLVVRVT